MSHKGFTIVELLIVIVIVAILAAITAVAYNGIQSKAHDAAIRSDFRAVANLLEIYRNDVGTYPHDPAGLVSGVCSGNPSGAVLQPILQSIDMKLSAGSYNTTTANTNLLYLASSDGTKYALLGFAKGNPTYIITYDMVSPKVYVPDPTNLSNSRYPGGNPCDIADNLGISVPSTNTDLNYYYIFVQDAGGFRVWK